MYSTSWNKNNNIDGHMATITWSSASRLGEDNLLNKDHNGE